MAYWNAGFLHLYFPYCSIKQNVLWAWHSTIYVPLRVSLLALIHSQLRSENIKWKIPEMNNT
jgi:hypothetical protein